jgi:hypothetical protein
MLSGRGYSFQAGSREFLDFMHELIRLACG